MRIRNGLLLATLLATLGTVPSVAQTACDPIDPSACMLPFPNDLFTVGTGRQRRLNLPVAGMPKVTSPQGDAELTGRYFMTPRATGFSSDTGI